MKLTDEQRAKIDEIVNCKHEKEHLKAFDLTEVFKDKQGNTHYENLHIQCGKCGIIMKAIANGKIEILTKQVIAAIEMQSAEVPEFDERAMNLELAALDLGMYEKSGFKRGARWQHSQDAAKLAQLQQELNDTQAAASIHADEHRKARKELAARQEQVRVLREALSREWPGQYGAEVMNFNRTILAQTEEEKYGKT